MKRIDEAKILLFAWLRRSPGVPGLKLRSKTAGGRLGQASCLSDLVKKGQIGFPENYISLNI